MIDEEIKIIRNLIYKSLIDGMKLVNQTHTRIKKNNIHLLSFKLDGDISTALFIIKDNNQNTIGGARSFIFSHNKVKEELRDIRIRSILE